MVTQPYFKLFPINLNNPPLRFYQSLISVNISVTMNTTMLHLGKTGWANEVIHVTRSPSPSVAAFAAICVQRTKVPTTTGPSIIIQDRCVRVFVCNVGVENCPCQGTANVSSLGQRPTGHKPDYSRKIVDVNISHLRSGVKFPDPISVRRFIPNISLNVKGSWRF